MLSDSERSMLLEQLARTPHSLIESYTHEGFARTPACGDEVTIRLLLDGSEMKAFGWVGHGCTVSKAATAALAGLMPLDVPSFRKLFERYTASVNGGPPLDGDLEAFAGIGRFPLRAQCATLAWRALAKALSPEPPAATAP